MPAEPGYHATIYVEDVARTLRYFTDVLGFREEERFVASDGTVLHGMARQPGGGGISIASIPAMLGSGYDLGEFGKRLRKAPLGNGVVLDYTSDDVDRYYQQVRKRGALIDEPPTDQFWGERTLSVRTPDGHYISFAQKIPGYEVDPAFGRYERPRRRAPPRRRARTVKRRPKRSKAKR